MGIEVEFLAVGDESTGGDAIIICIGPAGGPRDQQTVIIVDGGYKAAGEKVIEMLGLWYDTNVVDIFVSTHPDQDHISGLFPVLDQLEVHELWMHLPWNHSTELASQRARHFKSDRLEKIIPSCERSASAPVTSTWCRSRTTAAATTSDPPCSTTSSGYPESTAVRGSAVASVPAKNPESCHPNKRVTNAFRRRGYLVTVTQGEGPANVLTSRPNNNRTGYSSAEPLPFFNDFEDDK